MNEKSYSYGHGCAFFGGCHPSPSRQEVAVQAKKEGFGFIQQNSFHHGRVHSVILAWDIRVLDYDEAKRLFQDNKKILDEIDNHWKSRKAQVFLAAPAPPEFDGIDFFPFNLVDELRVVRYEDLLDPQFRT